jgi:hypothetical protein
MAVPFLLGRQVLNAGAECMFATRKMLAASSAEDCKHGDGDAPAYLAERCAARRRAR